MQRQRRLDDPGHAGRRVEVPDVGLQRADGCVLAAARVASVGAGQGRHLDGVAERRARPVRLDHADRVDVDLGDRQGLLDDGRLPFDARRREPDLGRAVVVHRGSLDHRVDRVLVAFRVREPLERDDRGPAGDDRAPRVGVERAAVTVGRRDPVLLIHVSDGRRDPDPAAAGDREVGLAGEQALDCEVHGHRGRRARGVHAERRPLEPQLVRDARDGVLALRRQQQRVVPGPGQQVAVLLDVVAEVRVGGLRRRTRRPGRGTPPGRSPRARYPSRRSRGRRDAGDR